MSTTMEVVLKSVRDALASIDGVKSCKVGMEPGITPADYPLVRIVPSTLTDAIPRAQVRQCECLIYFGLPLHEFTDGLEEVYWRLLEFEQQLLAAARAADSVASVVLIETILDEDKVDAYKLMALRVKINGSVG